MKKKEGQQVIAFVKICYYSYHLSWNCLSITYCSAVIPAFHFLWKIRVQFYIASIFLGVTISESKYYRLTNRGLVLLSFSNGCSVDFTDLAALENYAGNPFLPSDSDLLLDSPDQEDIGDFQCFCNVSIETLYFKSWIYY
jgi:hypothetical protein